jgi:hypothetical protein
MEAMQGEAMTKRKRGWNYFEACRANLTPEAKRNSRIFTVWCLGWALSFVGATRLLRNETVTAAPLTWLVALVPTLVGLLLIRSYVRFFRSADELMQKVHLEALAFGFGAGFLFMTGYSLFERLGAPAMSVSDPVAVIAFGWVLGQFLAMRRYS